MLDKDKELRLHEIKKGMGTKKYQDYLNIINEGIITKDDMINAGIITEKSIEKLKNINDNDIVINLSKPNYECPSECTDIYFIGTGCPGITCLNMGLLGSPNYKWVHNAHGQKLMQLCEMGLLPACTQGDFTHVTTGAIYDKENNRHNVNIIDYCSVVIRHITSDPNDRVAFADMHYGITRMLTNDNEKILFIIVDPTEESSAYRVEIDGGSTALTIYQEDCLLGFLDLLECPENKNVLNKVRTINIIITKSDCLSNEKDESDKIALDIVRNKYEKLISKLNKLCEDNDINIMFNNKPQLFTFSLGKFYYGSIFEYDSTDSDKLLERIAAMIPPERRKKTWYRKLKDWFNSQI